VLHCSWCARLAHGYGLIEMSGNRNGSLEHITELACRKFVINYRSRRTRVVIMTNMLPRPVPCSLAGEGVTRCRRSNFGRARALHYGLLLSRRVAD
jgi:hypothetical protein